MGCSASQPADELDSKAPLTVRGKRASSVAPLPQTTKAEEEDNPFLDPAPGIDEHRKSAATPASPPPAASPPVPSSSDVTPLPQPLSGRKASRTADDNDSDEEDEDKDSARSSKPPKTPRSRVTKAAATKADPDDDDDTEAASPHELPTPATSSRPQALSIALARARTFTELTSTQPPSLNLADPSRLTTQLPATFAHYARKLYDNSSSPSAPDPDDPEEERLDKRALQQLAYDCVLSFILALKKDMAARVKEPKRKEEEEFIRRKLLPGDGVDECVETAVGYLKSELIYKEGRITKTCFFFHFPRAYRAMFVYEKITLEREALVTKWNKVCAENRAKAERDKQKDRERLEKSVMDSEVKDGDGEKGEKKKKDKKSSKSAKKKKDRKTMPAGSDLLVNMGHGSKLVQAEKKLKSAAKASQSTRNLLQTVPKDEDDD